MPDTKSPKKQLILCIKSVLERYTDKAHRLSHYEIAALLESDFSLTADRKTVSRNLAALVKLGLDIDSDGGVFLASRPLADGAAVSAALLGLTLPSELLSPSAREYLSFTFAQDESGRTSNVAFLAAAIQAGDRISCNCPTWAILGYKPRTSQVVLRPDALYSCADGVRLAAYSLQGAACSVLICAMTNIMPHKSRKKLEANERQELFPQSCRLPSTPFYCAKRAHCRTLSVSAAQLRL